MWTCSKNPPGDGAGIAWVGDYLPEYKLAPELGNLLTVIENDGIARAISLLGEVAASARDDPIASNTAASGKEATLRYLLQGISVQGGLGSPANGTSTSSGSVRIEVMLASALPAHATDEAALQVARDKILAEALSGTPSANKGATPAAQAAAAWAADLAQICGGCVLIPRGSGLIGTAPIVILAVPLADLPEVVSYLAAQSNVHWLSPASEPKVANYYGTAISQSGQCESTYNTSNVGNSAYQYNDEGKHPIWSAGLTVRACDILFRGLCRV